MMRDLRRRTNTVALPRQQEPLSNINDDAPPGLFRGPRSTRDDLDRASTDAIHPEPDAIRGTAAIIRRIDIARQKMEQEEAKRIREELLRERDLLQVGETYEWDGVQRRVTWSGRSVDGPRRRNSTSSPHPPLGMSRMPDLEDDTEGELSPGVRRRGSMSVDEAMRRQIYSIEAESEEVQPQSFVGRVRNLFVPRPRSKSSLRDDYDAVIAVTSPHRDITDPGMSEVLLPFPAGSPPPSPPGLRARRTSEGGYTSIPPRAPRSMNSTSIQSPATQTTLETPYSAYNTDSGLIPESTDPHSARRQFSFQSVFGRHSRPQPQEEYLSVGDFNDYKLETTFSDGYVRHRIGKLERSTGSLEISTWRQKERIGSGAFGSVWLQQAEEGEQLRAVKILLRDSLPGSGYSRELLALLKSEDHGDLFLEFLGWYESGDHIFLAMEYMQHGNLQRYMRQDPRRVRSDAREITKQIFEGLEALHKRQMYHGNLKPTKILIAVRNPIRIKIADFGGAKLKKSTAARTRWGTDGYRAPELLGILPRQLNSKRFPTALDIWSLGSLVHEILTYQLPFVRIDKESGSGAGVVVGSGGGLDIRSLVDYCRGGEFPIRALQQSQASETGIDLIKNLLVADPWKRLNATSALQHPWLREPLRDPHVVARTS